MSVKSANANAGHWRRLGEIPEPTVKQARKSKLWLRLFESPDEKRRCKGNADVLPFANSPAKYRS